MATTKKGKAPANDVAKNEAPERELIGPNTNFTLVFSEAEVEQSTHRALTKLQKTVKIDGFRPGKTPLTIIKERIGLNALAEEALRLILPDKYVEYLKKEDKLSLCDPDFRLTKVNDIGPWEVEVSIAEAPEVNLVGYDKIVKKAITKEVGDDKQKAITAIITALGEAVEFKVPSLLLRRETESRLRELADAIAKRNMTLEQYLEQRQTTLEILQTEIMGQALAELRVDFILGAIAKEANIGVDKAEIETFLHRGQPVDENHHHEHEPAVERWAYAVILKDKVVNHLLQTGGLTGYTPGKEDKTAPKA